MIPKRFFVGMAAAAALSASAAAQLPGGPPAALPFPNAPGALPPVTSPIPPAPGALGIAPGPALPTNKTLWSFMGVSADQREFRRRQAARTPLGQLRERVRAPLTKLSGGLIPPLVPNTPTLAELQAPGAVGAAAAVKLDRAGAEDRMKAVEYLAGVDCATWPEAEEALGGALRADRNECVRLKAAQVLQGGCCCTKKTVKALTNAVEGTDCDGHPAEKSPRVRAAAQAALEKCLACFIDHVNNCPDRANCDKPTPPGPPLDKQPEPGKKSGTDTSARPTPEQYYRQVAATPAAEVIEAARKALNMPIPEWTPGQGVNATDVEAAGLPAPSDAAARAPRPASVLGWFTAADTPPAHAVRPAAHREPPSMAPPVRTAMSAAPAARTAPAAKPAAAVAPAAVAPSAAPAALPAMAPAGMAVSVRPPETRAAKAQRMFNSVVPVADLTAAVDALTADDLKGSPAVVGELVAAGCKCPLVPVRLAAARCLVRCKVETPEVKTALRELAQADPDAAVRMAAGVKGK